MNVSPFSIKQQVPLADKNWFGTGGAARFYAEPSSVDDFSSSLEFARQKGLDLFVLGSGANILISDAGFDGLVLRPHNTSIMVTDRDSSKALVTAGAGVTIDALIAFCLDHQLLGLEELSGIPGTVGGSVFINIHYFEFFLSHFLVSARVVNVETGELMPVSRDWFAFGYDYSTLHARKHVLFDATFQLKIGTEIEAAYARGRSKEIDRHRRQRYPYKGTCGSFFRNFHDHEVTIVSNGKKMIYVAYYLDKLGIKGELSVGGAVVSHQHANMIVNKGNATSTDIATLARTMQERVLENFGIIPEPECQLVGFQGVGPLLALSARVQTTSSDVNKAKTAV
ncbi:TPA: UDP-N-acetylenolpyruvoylglucosamine reductase [Candidatus Dependentiae bacterium]|nr:MAG: UDP-N-acetylenolpyruvoylglucosamine reductase [candidate division TM6 bacterium GW2011_GWF2_43_87]HBL98539.1 UDP-N-acetylenolpyruvoylglucosamine reductase [Candidatus Dependentiae bacterium]